MSDFQGEYLLAYAAVIMLCGALAVMMSLKMNHSLGGYEQVRTFHMCAAGMVAESVCQLAWALGSMFPAHFTPELNFAINACEKVAMLWVVYSWCLFVTSGIPSQRRSGPVRRLLAFAPFAIGSAASVVSSVTGWIFYITDANVYVRGPLFMIVPVCCYVYYLGAVIMLAGAGDTPAPGSSATPSRLLLATFFPMVGGAVQVLAQDVPWTSITVVLALFSLFVAIQDRQITTDALTGLNNRKRVESALEPRLNRSSDRPIVVCLADMDDFKRTNDTYGHTAGDRVLVLAADALRQVLADHHTGFACRYGGDEFLFFADEADVGSADALVAEITRAFADCCDRDGLEFEVSMSVGATTISDVCSPEEAVSRADEKLYQRKASLR